MANEMALPFPGQNTAGQEDEQEQRERKSPADVANKARDVANKARGIANNAKRITDAAQKARAAAQAVQAAAAAANPWVIAIILAVVGVILIYIFFFSHGSALEDNNSDTATTTAPGGGTIPPKGIPGLSITMTGPQVVNNGEDIEYTISYTYDVSLGKVPLESILLFDTVPQNASFVSTSGVQAADSTPTLVTWSLQDPANQKPFNIVLHPTVEDSYVQNTVSAKITAGAGGSPSPQEFKDLITGQGRNTAVLGDKNMFISTVITNSSGLPLSGKESYLSQIYDAGIQYGVNPLILTVIWGVEFGFDPTPDYPFGCLNPADKGFTENSTCAAGSLNQLMSKFETQNIGGSLEIPSTTGNTCIYSDAFDYAYEMYTPVCHANDGNDPARTNFITFYRKLKGI